MRKRTLLIVGALLAIESLVAGRGVPLRVGRASAAVVQPRLPWNEGIDRLARTPVAEPRNLRGYGALAIRQGRDLYIVDGDAAAANGFRRVERGATVRAMSWSHDGRWLAYATDSGVWLTARDGSMKRRIMTALGGMRLDGGDRFEWSPRVDVLCISRRTGPSFTPPISPTLGYPQASTHRIYERGATALVSPHGAVSPIAADAFPDSLHWATTGRTIERYAFTTVLPYVNWPSSRDAIVTATPGGDMAEGRGIVRAESNQGGQLAVAMLTPRGDGMLYWSGTERSASDAADGQTLMVQSDFGHPPRSVGTMLEHQWWISFDHNASRFVFVSGAFREAWLRKSLEVCSLRGARCRALPQPTGVTSLDPRWRPSDASIVLVRANAHGANTGYGDRFIPDWVDARTLWLQDADSGRARRLAAFGSGVFWPRWSKDGQRLMAFRDGAIWIGGVDGERPKRVASGLATPAEFPVPFMDDHGAVDDETAPFVWTDAAGESR